MAEVYETDQRPKRRKGRGLLIVLVVLLLLLLGGLVVADRFGKSFAERVIADKVTEQVRAQKASSGTPDVTIEGFPFLTQVLNGKYQEIHIQIPDMRAPVDADREVSLNLLDIHAKDVLAPLSALRTGQGDITVSTVTASGTIDYPQLVQLIGRKDVSLSSKDGKLIGSIKTTVLGQQVDLTGTAQLTVVNGGIRVRFAGVKATNLPDIPLIQNLVDSNARKMAFDFPAPKLPLQLKVQAVVPETDGLNLTLGASDVNLNSGGL